MTEDKDVAYLPIVYEVSDPKNTPEKTLNIYNDWASTYDQVENFVTVAICVLNQIQNLASGVSGYNIQSQVNKQRQCVVKLLRLRT